MQAAALRANEARHGATLPEWPDSNVARAAAQLLRGEWLAPSASASTRAQLPAAHDPVAAGSLAEERVHHRYDVTWSSASATTPGRACSVSCLSSSASPIHPVRRREYPALDLAPPPPRRRRPVGLGISERREAADVSH
jgi:hypothetical protein